jgi:hypothetical protein
MGDDLCTALSVPQLLHVELNQRLLSLMCACLKVQWEEKMIRLIAFAAFALAVATSAQAMSPAPLHQADGMITQVHDDYTYGHRHHGYRHYGYKHYYGGHRH